MTYFSISFFFFEEKDSDKIDEDAWYSTNRDTEESEWSCLTKDDRNG